MPHANEGTIFDTKTTYSSDGKKAFVVKLDGEILEYKKMVTGGTL